MHDIIKAWLDKPETLYSLATVAGIVFLLFCVIIYVEVRARTVRASRLEPERFDVQPGVHLFRPTRDGLVRDDHEDDHIEPDQTEAGRIKLGIQNPPKEESDDERSRRLWKELVAKRETAWEQRLFKFGDLAYLKGNRDLLLTVGGCKVSGGEHGDPIVRDYDVVWFDKHLECHSKNLREEMLTPLAKNADEADRAALLESIVTEMEDHLRADNLNDSVLLRRYGEPGQETGWTAYVSWLKSDGGEPLYCWEASRATLSDAIIAVSHRVRDGLNKIEAPNVKTP